MVDRTLNEWSEWQLKNLNAIVWLYRGEVDKYQALVEEYSEALGGRDFDTVLETLEEEKAQLITEGKEAAAAAPRKEKKAVEADYAQKVADVEASIVVTKEALWLTKKFGEGNYCLLYTSRKARTLTYEMFGLRR